MSDAIENAAIGEPPPFQAPGVELVQKTSSEGHVPGVDVEPVDDVGITPRTASQSKPQGTQNASNGQEEHDPNLTPDNLAKMRAEMTRRNQALAEDRRQFQRDRETFAEQQRQFTAVLGQAQAPRPDSSGTPSFVERLDPHLRANLSDEGEALLNTLANTVKEDFAPIAGQVDDLKAKLETKSNELQQVQASILQKQWEGEAAGLAQQYGAEAVQQYGEAMANQIRLSGGSIGPRQAFQMVASDLIVNQQVAAQMAKLQQEQTHNTRANLVEGGLNHPSEAPTPQWQPGESMEDSINRQLSRLGQQ